MTTLTLLTKAAERLVPESDGRLRKRLELAQDTAQAVDGVPGLSAWRSRERARPRFSDDAANWCDERRGYSVVIVVTAAQFAVTYLPPLQSILGTEPVALTDGLLIVGIGVAFFTVIEIEKQIRLGLKRG